MTTLEEQDIDALCELVNIASGNAATALALLVGRRTMISVPRVSLEPVDRIATLLGVPEQPAVVVSMQVFGDVSGYLLFLMPMERAHVLSAMLLGLQQPRSDAFDEEGQSSLQETANVLAGAYVGALGSVLGGIVMISAPDFLVTPGNEVLARYGRTPDVFDDALCIETEIRIGEGGVSCGAHIVLLPVGGAVGAIVDTLKARL